MVAKKVKQKTQQENEMKICICCGKEKKDIPNNFYQNVNPRVSNKVGLCKSCIKDIVDYNDVSSVDFILRILDRPFIKEMWEEALKSNDDTWGAYIRPVSSLPQYKDMRYKDSNLFLLSNGQSITNNTTEEGTLKYSQEQLREWEKSFGKGYSVEDYEYLDKFYSDYTKSYATDTPVQINLYKNIAKVHLQAEKELIAGNISNFNKLMETSSKLHNDGNIKPIQSTGANDDKGLSTYGLWIKMIENDEPCEVFDKKPLFEDFDHINEYFQKWIVRPFKKIFGLDRDDVDG